MSRLVEFDFSDLLRQLDRYEARVENLRSVNMRGADVLILAVEDEFETEGQGEWPDLSEATKKRRRGTSFKILQDSTHLVGSHQRDAGADFFEVFTNVPYAVPHLDGASDGNWEMPQRDFHDVDMDEVGESFAADLLQELAR